MAQDECISDTCTSTNYLWSGTWVSQLCEHRRPPKFQANLFEFVDLFPTQDTACDISPTEEECSVLDGFVYNKEDNSCQKACFEKHIQSKCVGTGGGGEWYRRVPEANDADDCRKACLKGYESKINPGTIIPCSGYVVNDTYKPTETKYCTLYRDCASTLPASINWGTLDLFQKIPCS